MRRPVLVFVDRRIEGLVGFMGVVESGNFYVPIDCKMPDQRVKLINDVLNPIAAITTTVADDKILDLIEFKGVRFNYAEVIDNKIDKAYIADVRSKVIDTDPLYSIFTSGSLRNFTNNFVKVKYFLAIMLSVAPDFKQI